MQLYNLGVGGTGITQFLVQLKCARDRLDFDEIVIAAISDDLERRSWRPVEAEGLLHFCPVDYTEAWCLRRASRLLILPSSTASQDLLIDQAYKDHRLGYGVKEFIKNKTHIGGIMRDVRKVLATMMRTGRNGSNPTKSHIQNVLRSLHTLSSIRRLFPKEHIIFMHLPQKNEVLDSAYQYDLASIIDDLGMEYYAALHRCDFTIDGFFDKDGHPNQAGYKMISACAKQMLKDISVSRGLVQDTLLQRVDLE